MGTKQSKHSSDTKPNTPKRSRSFKNIFKRNRSSHVPPRRESLCNGAGEHDKDSERTLCNGSGQRDKDSEKRDAESKIGETKDDCSNFTKRDGHDLSDASSPPINVGGGGANPGEPTKDCQDKAHQLEHYEKSSDERLREEINNRVDVPQPELENGSINLPQKDDSDMLPQELYISNKSFYELQYEEDTNNQNDTDMSEKENDGESQIDSTVSELSLIGSANSPQNKNLKLNKSGQQETILARSEKSGLGDIFTHSHEMARQKGFHIHDCGGQGDCQFLSLVHQLNHNGCTQWDAHSLRTAIVRDLRENPRTAAGDSLHGFIPGYNLEEYLRQMTQDETWGDQITLLGASRLLRRPIRIINLTDDQVPEFVEGQRQENRNYNPLILGYIRNNPVNHYVSLIPIPGSELQAPMSVVSTEDHQPVEVRDNEVVVALTEDTGPDSVTGDKPPASLSDRENCQLLNICLQEDDTLFASMSMEVVEIREGCIEFVLALKSEDALKHLTPDNLITIQKYLQDVLKKAREDKCYSKGNVDNLRLLCATNQLARVQEFFKTEPLDSSVMIRFCPEKNVKYWSPDEKYWMAETVLICQAGKYAGYRLHQDDIQKLRQKYVSPEEYPESCCICSTREVHRMTIFDQKLTVEQCQSELTHHNNIIQHVTDSLDRWAVLWGSLMSSEENKLKRADGSIITTLGEIERSTCTLANAAREITLTSSFKLELIGISGNERSMGTDEWRKKSRTGALGCWQSTTWHSTADCEKRNFSTV